MCTARHIPSQFSRAIRYLGPVSGEFLSRAASPCQDASNQSRDSTSWQVLKGCSLIRGWPRRQRRQVARGSRRPLETAISRFRSRCLVSRRALAIISTYVFGASDPGLKFRWAAAGAFAFEETLLKTTHKSAFVSTAGRRLVEELKITWLRLELFFAHISFLDEKV